MSNQTFIETAGSKQSNQQTMCGISGIINKGQHSYTAKDIAAMTNVVSHRGPDDEGYVLFTGDAGFVAAGGESTSRGTWESDVPYKPSINIAAGETNYDIAFGHRRLSILDLSAYGHCPMSYANGRYWITFNGEIYNFNQLKEELGQLGHHFISHTDTEVVLAAYAQWGVGCLQKFNGMWAFAIYDIEAKEIFLARDRFGIKPLYYWAPPGKPFCFASEIKQFTVLPGWQATLNGQRAFDYLVYNMTDHTDETMFAGVYHIPAGHYYKSSVNNIQTDKNGRVQLIKWYQPNYTSNNIPFNEAATAFEKYFKESVKEHLVSDVAVGSALSGGLDSTAIVCEINNLLKEEGNRAAQKTFSYCTADERYNEKKWVDEAVKAVKVDAHYINETSAGAIEKALELVWYHDEPNQSQSELATYHVYKLAKDNNVKVLINGQGADEYLSGYEAFTNFRWLQLLKKGKFKKLNHEIANSTTYANDGILATYIHLCYYLVPSFVRVFFSKKTKSYKTLSALVSLQHLKAKEQHPYDSMGYKSDSIFSIAHRQLLHNPLPKYLRYEDRMSMANSVEARVPFLSHRLVEFATQLPADYLDGIGETKKLLLHGLRKIVPQAILSRKDKIGFVTSEEGWVKKELTGQFRKQIEAAIANSKGIIQPAALEYFDGIVNGTQPFNYNYWRLIAFGEWMKRFNVQAA